MDKLPMPRIGTAKASTALSIPRAEMEARREAMLSLPGWVTSRLGWLGTVTVDEKTSYYLTRGLPELTAEGRTYLKQRLELLDGIILPAEDDDAGKLVFVTKMMMALASAKMSEAGAQAHGEAYLFALGDVPAWAVGDSIGRWYKGSAKDVDESDYKWAPAPAVLLRVANDVLEPYRDTAIKIKRLLDVRPLDEILDSQGKSLVALHRSFEE